MRKAEMMGFAEIVRQETTIKQRMIVEHSEELAAHVKRLEEVGAVLMRQTPTETVYDAARRVMMELARLKNTSVFVEKLSAIDAEEQQHALRVKLQQAQVEATHATTKLNIVSKAYDEALALCHGEGMTPAEQIKALRTEVDKLNVEVEDRRQAFAMWSQSTEKVLHRLGSKQGESIEEALNRWLGEHTKNLQANRNTLRLYEAAMELCEGGMVPSEQIIKLRGLVNTLQQQLTDTAERAAFGQLVVAPRDQLIENDEMRNANTKLREEVAALQERLRASIQRADFAQIEVDRLKAQSATTPKSESTIRNHPLSVGEWVAKDWKQAAQVVEVDAEHAEYKIRFVGSKVVEVWHFGHCQPCNPPTLEALQAHHDRVVEYMQDAVTRLNQMLTAVESERDSLLTDLAKERAAMEHLRTATTDSAVEWDGFRTKVRELLGVTDSEASTLDAISKLCKERDKLRSTQKHTGCCWHEIARQQDKTLQGVTNERDELLRQVKLSASRNEGQRSIGEIAEAERCEIPVVMPLRDSPDFACLQRMIKDSEAQWVPPNHSTAVHMMPVVMPKSLPQIMRQLLADRHTVEDIVSRMIPALKQRLYDGGSAVCLPDDRNVANAIRSALHAIGAPQPAPDGAAAVVEDEALDAVGLVMND